MAEEVGALPDPAVRALLPVLRDALVETARGYERWLKTVPNGADRFTAQDRRAVLVHLEHALQAIERRVGGELVTQLSTASHGAARLAAKNLVDEVARLSTIFGDSEQRLPLSVAAMIATSDSYLVPRFEASAARYADAHYERKRGESEPTNIADDIRHQLAVGVASRDSVFGMTERLVRLGGPTGLVALRGIHGKLGAVVEPIAEGLFVRYRPWAQRIVRTEVIAAYAYQQHAALWQASKYVRGLKRRWSSALTGRTCAACFAMHGAVAELGGVFTSPLGDTATDPPLHPNCMCRAGAFKEEWKSLLDEVDAV